MFAFLWGVGCVSDFSESRPLPYSYSPPVEDGPAFSAQHVESAIQSTVDQIRSWHAGPVFDAYDQAMSQADLSCPAFTNLAGRWDNRDIGGCTSVAGVSFSGLGEPSDDPGSKGAFGATYVFRRTLRTDPARIVAEGGDTLDFSGTAEFDYATGGPYGVEHYSSRVSGRYDWDGIGGSKALFDELGPRFTMSFDRFAVPAGRLVQISLGRNSVPDLVISDFVLAESSLGSTCAEEPHGVVSIRDDRGY